MSSKRLPLSVIIPAQNEADRIGKGLDSVQFAEEILVVDSFSTDDTVEIAKSKGARVIQQEYRYAASQKNRSIPKAKHEWVLILDADEWICPELKNEIEDLLEKESPANKGYAIPE